jgi:hypothetical protein
MASKGLRAILYQFTRKVEAGYKPSDITETLIDYIVCWAHVVNFYCIHILSKAKYLSKKSLA